MGNKRKLGVVGLGEGRSIMSAALQSDCWELAMTCDLNEELCRQRAEEFGHAAPWTTQYGDMLARSDIDAIAIYTPDQLHFAHIVQALEAGKHVVCTKPLLPSLERAAELLDAIARSGKRVFVGQSSRFFEPMIRQRADYEAGKHGDVSVVEAQYITDGRWFLDKPWSRQPGFSWMYGFMIHAVDLVRWYLPHVNEVTGYARTSGNSRSCGVAAADSLRFLLRDPDGRIGQIAGDYAKPTLDQQVEPSMSCVIRGTSGTSRAEYSNLRYHTHFAGEPARTYNDDDKHGYYFRFEGKSHHAGEYQNYIDYFASCLDQGAAAIPDAAEAVRTLALMLAMERSSLAGGVPVRLDEVLDEFGIR